jgi:hypothetical protein
MKTILQKDRFHSAAQLVDSLEDLILTAKHDFDKDGGGSIWGDEITCNFDTAALIKETRLDGSQVYTLELH